MSEKEKLKLLAIISEVQNMNNAASKLYSISQEENSINNQENNLLLPAVILISFTCELCIKAILMMNGTKKISKIHDLKTLFNQLDPVHQTSIKKSTVETNLNNFKNINFINFDKELESIAYSFQNLRYIYEKFEVPNLHLINFGFLNAFRFALLQEYVEIENNFAASNIPTNPLN
ncbi:hypothetical protein [Anaerocolumna jejuensis]|uniref:hypothetical protein n=1 Tax=Anaerocolumna jejuensis TaxID=259063 RepID=UPI003F7C5699